MHFGLLTDIVLTLGLAIIVMFIFYRFKFPAIIGLLLAGIIAGPHGVGLISGIEEVEILGEIGVILLLFAIGIEFSMKNLIRLRKTLLLGGSVQVLLTIMIITVIAYYYKDNSIQEAIFIGFLIALSSTAIVLKLLRDKGELESAHGRVILGILIFQDLIIVPMILLIPYLSGDMAASSQSIWMVMLKFISIILFVLIGSRYLIPRILFLIAKTQSKELFNLSIIVIAFSVAFITQSMGLSLALGAFLAGLMISESDYSQAALGNILPFLHVFTSFFFLSIGMMLDISYVLANPLHILFFTVLVLSIKTLIAALAAFILGYPLRTVILVGFTISQVGEFSFILALQGSSAGLLSPENYQLFLNISVLSMATTPLAILFASKFGSRVMKLNIPDTIRFGYANIPESKVASMDDHVVIVGYGINGRNVARATKHADIPHVIIELNPETVRQEKAEGEIIFFGDATQPEVLEHAFIQSARILVITIPGTGEAARIIGIARAINPELFIIVRTHLVHDLTAMYDAGADEVIPEEFETSVEIFTRVMQKYDIPKDQIETLIDDVRSDGYQVFRN
ncbi:MAG: cation:proton antiporter [Bacteroidales bacterium]|jgi:monovalent cation:H+ antiporter-2, CPA2 family